MWFGESVFKCHWVENVNWVTAPWRWPAVFCGRLRTGGLILGIEDVTGSSRGRMKAKRKRIATFTGRDVCRLLKASFLSACFHSCLQNWSASLRNGDGKGEVKLELSIRSVGSLLRIPPDDAPIFTFKTNVVYVERFGEIRVGENKLKSWKTKVIFYSSAVWKTERIQAAFQTEN